MRIMLTHDVTIHKRASSALIQKLMEKTGFLDKILFRLPQSAIDSIFDDYYTINERIAETPFLFMHLGTLAPGSRILDVGCDKSVTSIRMATLGFKVYGIDINDYPFEHPNFSFIRESICKNSFEDGFFDMVTAVSTVEHIGLGHYGDNEEDSDIKAIVEIRRILKKGGYLILTIPYGKKTRTEWFRIYDADSLRELVSGLEILDAKYFLSNGEKYWTISDPEELPMYSINERGKSPGCACLFLRKSLY